MSAYCAIFVNFWDMNRPDCVTLSDIIVTRCVAHGSDRDQTAQFSLQLELDTPASGHDI